MLTGLRRVISSGYRVEDAVTIEQAQQMADEGRLRQMVMPVETAFAPYEQIVLTAKHARLFQNGVRLAASRAGCAGLKGDFCVFGPDRHFLGIGYEERSELRIRKLFAR